LILKHAFKKILDVQAYTYIFPEDIYYKFNQHMYTLFTYDQTDVLLQPTN